MIEASGENPYKKNRASSRRLEDKLRAKCVVSFSQERPEERGKLWGNFSEVESEAQGGIRSSLGLVRGVPDLMYSRTKSCLVGLECKYPGTYHDVEHLREQSQWMLDNCSEAWFFDTFEIFWDAIRGHGAIPAQLVLDKLKDVKTGSVIWNFGKC